MRLLLPSFCLVLLTALPQPSTATQAETGIVLKTFDVRADRLLLDPTRPQLYATLPASNGIAVIDTHSNTVVTTLTTGPSPGGLAISPDGARLYVLNGGSASAGIGVVDLTTLTVLPSLPTTFAVSSIVAGLGNRLYLAGYNYQDVVQIDATTGDIEATLTPPDYGSLDLLAMSPDAKTLYCGDEAFFGLVSFDVSTATPVVLQSTQSFKSAESEDLAVSHNGQFLVYPSYTGNSTPPYTTWLIPTANFNAVSSTFATGASCGLTVFSADDSMLYQVQAIGDNPYNVLKVFSTRFGDLLNAFDLPAPADVVNSFTSVTGLAITSPNGYLYMAQTDGSYYSDPRSDLVLISTQGAPFFNNAVTLTEGFSYLQFPDNIPFGYYDFNYTPYLYHDDLGFEYPVDAADGDHGIYLYDFTSKTFFYTSPDLFPYLYDFSLNTFLYYYPDTANPGHYTAKPRYFYDFAAGQIITK